MQGMLYYNTSRQAGQDPAVSDTVLDPAGEKSRLP